MCCFTRWRQQNSEGCKKLLVARANCEECWTKPLGGSLSQLSQLNPFKCSCWSRDTAASSNTCIYRREMRLNPSNYMTQTSTNFTRCRDKLDLKQWVRMTLFKTWPHGCEKASSSLEPGSVTAIIVQLLRLLSSEDSPNASLSSRTTMRPRASYSKWSSREDSLLIKPMRTRRKRLLEETSILTITRTFSVALNM